MHSNFPAGSDAYPPDDHDETLDHDDDVFTCSTCLTPCRWVEDAWYCPKCGNEYTPTDDDDELDLPAPGDRYRIRLELLALDGTRVTRGTLATFVARLDRPGLGPLWNMLRTDDGRDVPVLIDPISVDKLPNEVSA